MKLSQFKFKLPDELVALYPHQSKHSITKTDGTKETFTVLRSDECRLMVAHKKSGKIEMFKKGAKGKPVKGDFLTFWDMLDYFGEGDTFVFNDTKVFPARLVWHQGENGCENRGLSPSGTQ
jgi:S-adenosylmethionine:tRNA ribosyltransferase-isomerase